MKSYLLVLFSFISISIFSQETTSSLAVAGKARLMVTPDLAVIKVELAALDKDYATCISSLQKKSDNFKSFLEDLKIEKEYVKSENFKIERQYDYSQKIKNFVGYRSQLFIRLEIMNNIEVTNKIINSLSLSNTDANISIDFEMSISKQDSINNKLIEYAIIDARKKADIIAKSTKQTIVRIDKIDYGVQEGIYITELYDEVSPFQIIEEDNAIKSFIITPQQVEKGTQIVIFYKLRKI